MQNSISPKIKEPPEKNSVCKFSTKNGSPITWLHMLFPVYIRPWSVAIAMGTGKQAQSLPVHLLVEEVFSTRQVHLSRWPSQLTLSVTADKECHLSVFVKLSSAASRGPPARHRGIAKQNPSYRHCEGFSVPQLSALHILQSFFCHAL